MSPCRLRGSSRVGENRGGDASRCNRGVLRNGNAPGHPHATEKVLRRVSIPQRMRTGARRKEAQTFPNVRGDVTGDFSRRSARKRNAPYILP